MTQLASDLRVNYTPSPGTWPPARSTGQGLKEVTAAGTPEKLVAAATPCSMVILTAQGANTDRIAYGGSNAVRATTGAEVGATLGAGESVGIDIDDVSKVWIDAAVSGEGASFTYVVR